MGELTEGKTWGGGRRERRVNENGRIYAPKLTPNINEALIIPLI